MRGCLSRGSHSSHKKRDRGVREREEALHDPEDCIDCGACEPVCPVEAIFEEAATPDKWKQFIQMDADWYKERLTSGSASCIIPRRAEGISSALF